MVYTPPRRKLTADEYQRMGEVGIFHEDDRVELIDGELYEMTPIGDGHIGAIDSLNSLLNRLLHDRAIVSIQNPIRLDEFSEPQPDISVRRPRDDFYRAGKARPADILLLIEVSESSLAYDRDTKLPRYALAGIREVWIVNLVAGQIEVYREPSGADYALRRIHRRPESVSPLAFPDIAIGVGEILG